MLAAWYERKGPARDVLVVGDMPTPEPGHGEVRVRLMCAGGHAPRRVPVQVSAYRLRPAHRERGLCVRTRRRASVATDSRRPLTWSNAQDLARTQAWSSISREG